MGSVDFRENAASCEHKTMVPLYEPYVTKSGRERNRPIWYCYECKHSEPRECIVIWCEEDGSVDTADNIRALNILSSHLGITHKEVQAKLLEATEEKPIEYQGGAKFWAERDS